MATARDTGTELRSLRAPWVIIREVAAIRLEVMNGDNSRGSGDGVQM